MTEITAMIEHTIVLNITYDLSKNAREVFTMLHR